jgi:hypothetical protein
MLCVTVTLRAIGERRPALSTRTELQRSVVFHRCSGQEQCAPRVDGLSRESRPVPRKPVPHERRTNSGQPKLILASRFERESAFESASSMLMAPLR